MFIHRVFSLCICLCFFSLSTQAGAAYFDFEQWVQDNGAQGFDNSNPFKLSVDGLQLKAKAFNKPQKGVHVYLEDTYNGSSGGMGVCSSLDINNYCVTDSIVEGQDKDRLRWIFSENISSISLTFDNDINGFANRKFQYKYDSNPWTTVRTNASSFINLNFDGSSRKIQFRTKGKNAKNEFYILNADVTAVPVPPAMWLFLSGLLGLMFISRRSEC